MKGRGRHPVNKLTTVSIKALKKPGRYADGGGLYLVVDDTGAKRWSLRVMVHGRRRELGLGGLGVVPLAEAREKALQYLRIAKTGEDPIAAKRNASRTVPTFKAAAVAVHTEHSTGWKHSKHAAQWIKSLQHHAFPIIGDRRVDQIDTPDLLRVLSPIWLSKPVTARRVRQRIETVLNWAKAAGHRSGENPVDGVHSGLPKQGGRVKHHAALPYDDVPAVFARLGNEDGGTTARLAFQFLILTAARTGEVLGARRAEFDLKQKLWTIPATRMKAGREHRVPLSPAAVEVLERAFALFANQHLAFPSSRFNRPLWANVFFMTLRRMGVEGTPHGFRSAFRDWASERTNFSREVAEMALAHTIKDKTEAAYRRGDLFEKRRALMDAWAGFVTATPGKVVQIGRRA